MVRTHVLLGVDDARLRNKRRMEVKKMLSQQFFFIIYLFCIFLDFCIYFFLSYFSVSIHDGFNLPLKMIVNKVQMS